MGAGANRGVAALGDAELPARREPRRRAAPRRASTPSSARSRRTRPGAIVGPTILTEARPPYPSVRRFPSVARRGRARDARARVAAQPVHPPLPRAGRGTPTARRTGCRARASSCAGSSSSGSAGSTSATSCSPRTWTCAGEPSAPGAAVGTAPDAVVTHVEGVSRRVAPYRMQVAHHRSALRFAVATTTRAGAAAPAGRRGGPRGPARRGARGHDAGARRPRRRPRRARRRRRARDAAAARYAACGLRAGLWLKVEASRRRNDPRKATLGR